MIRSFTLLAFALLLTSLPTWAQYAYSKVAIHNETSSETDPGETSKVVAYRVVHGVVQGKNGALPGATVWLHGTRTVVVTNAEGEFELKVPTTAKQVQLTCGYGGLFEEVVTLAPVQALGSIYLLRSKTPGGEPLVIK